MSQPLSKEDLQAMDAYWRAANYLSVGQTYLYDNPLLKEPLRLEHIKPKLGYMAAYTKQVVRDRLIDHKEYIRRYGQDMPEIRTWTWRWADG